MISYMRIIILIIVAVISLLAMALIIYVIGKKSALGTTDDFITATVKKKKEEIRVSGITFPPALYFSLYLIFPLIIGGVVYLTAQNLTPAIAMALISLFLPEMILKALISRQTKLFDERYARALEQLASSLRAGLSLYRAINDVTECPFVHESMKVKFAKLSSDLQLGITVGEAFSRFAEDCPGTDAKDIALAINVQSEIGGRESEIIQEIADNIHQRAMMRKEIRTIFATTKIMVLFTDFLAPGVIFFTIIGMPTLVSCYFESMEMMLVFIGIICLPIIGSFWNHFMMQKVKKRNC